MPIKVKKAENSTRIKTCNAELLQQPLLQLYSSPLFISDCMLDILVFKVVSKTCKEPSYSVSKSQVFLTQKWQRQVPLK